MIVRRKLIRRTVDGLLKRHGVEEAPVPVEEIARSEGTLVERAATDEDLSGFLYRSAKKNAPAIIGVNANHHPNRQSFTVAHELGHFLLHDAQEVHVDRGFQVKLRSRKSSEGTNVEEKEANLFAAELLMPAAFLERDVKEIDGVDLVEEEVLAGLARRYGVSTQAMTFRLAYLGYIQL